LVIFTVEIHDNLFMKTKKHNSKYTPEDLAEAIAFPVSLSKMQKKTAAKQLAEARRKTQKDMSEVERMSLSILQLKFQLEDYIQNKMFDADKTFGSFLKQYVESLNIKRKQFAEDISIDEALLSQFINEHRMPPDYIAIRLEIHSNNSIPANYWFKLVEKQREHELNNDKEIRKKEKRFVHRKILLRFS